MLTRRTIRSLTIAALCVGAALTAVTPSGAGGAGDYEDNSPAAMMARVEGAQSPNRQGHDPLTLQQIMEKYRVPGVSVAVIKDFAIHWAKGYGVTDINTGAPVAPDTMFQAASISKPVAAMAVLDTLDKPVPR